MMMGWGVFTLSYRGGDLLGSRIYASNPINGFFYCVIITALVYTLIFPLIYLVPKALIATADGEPNRRSRRRCSRRSNELSRFECRCHAECTETRALLLASVEQDCGFLLPDNGNWCPFQQGRDSERCKIQAS
jgi:hypothetical protein